MIHVQVSSRSILVPKPDSSGQKKSVQLSALVTIGPLKFGIHPALDSRSSRLVVTELSSKSVIAIGWDQLECIENLRKFLISKSMFDWLHERDQLTDSMKQDISRFFTRPVIAEDASDSEKM